MKGTFLASGWNELTTSRFHCDTEIFINNHFLRLVAEVNGNTPVYNQDSVGIIPSNIKFMVMLYKSCDRSTHDHCEVSVDELFQLDEKKIRAECRIIHDYELTKVFKGRLTKVLVSLARQQLEAKKAC